MLYITYRNSRLDATKIEVHRIWELERNIPVKYMYHKWIIDQSRFLDINIDKRTYVCLSINDNSHLSELEYIKKQSTWRGYLRQWSIDRYIEVYLKGTKRNFENVNL